jgi:hypothetical protein
VVETRFGSVDVDTNFDMSAETRGWPLSTREVMHTRHMAASYDDGRISCDESGVTIRMYYFPMGSKKIPYSKIESVSRKEMGGSILSGRLRIWGSGDFVHWFNLDPARPTKSIAFEIHLTGKKVTPVVTPDDPTKFAEVLHDRGVTVA